MTPVWYGAVNGLKIAANLLLLKVQMNPAPAVIAAVVAAHIIRRRSRG